MRVPLDVDEQLLARHRDPVAPRQAATIALLRRDGGALCTYLLRRASSMEFAPGRAVFPGGRVDAADAEPIDAVGPSWQDWGQTLDCPPDLARSLIVAAARETFEESGILLAGPDATTITIPDPTWATRMRTALEAHDIGFAAVLADAGLVLRTDLIGAWSRWITPTIEARRYDTRILVAWLPDGQQVGELSREAQDAHWTPIAEALAAIDRGELSMLPPTHVTCRQLLDAGDDPLAAARGRSQRPIEPRLVQADGRWWLENDSDGADIATYDRADRAIGDEPTSDSDTDIDPEEIP